MLPTTKASSASAVFQFYKLVGKTFRPDFSTELLPRAHEVIWKSFLGWLAMHQKILHDWVAQEETIWLEFLVNSWYISRHPLKFQDCLVRDSFRYQNELIPKGLSKRERLIIVGIVCWTWKMHPYICDWRQSYFAAKYFYSIGMTFMYWGEWWQR